MMHPDGNSLAMCIQLRKIYDYMMKPGLKSFLDIRVNPCPSVTSHMKALFWLQDSSNIEETGYVMQPDRSRLATCIKLRKIYDYTRKPG